MPESNQPDTLPDGPERKPNFARRHLLRFLLLGLSALMLALVGSGVLSKAKPGTLTWGPTVDINAMSIAFNAMYTGRMEGLGRKETALAVARFVTKTGDELKIGDDPSLVADVERVNAGVDNARTIFTPDLAPTSLTGRLIVTTIAEDIGYADFYYYAFKLFGVSGLSTHFFFLSLLIGSAILYGAGLWRSLPGLACLCFVTAAFFALTTGNVFSESAPSLAANRFLATLIVIPTLHIMFFAIGRQRPAASELIALALQTMVFAFVIGLRSSGTWAVVGLVATMMVVLVMRLGVWLWQRKSEHGRRPMMLRLVGSVVAAVVLSTSWQAARESMLHPVYRGTDVLAHHLRWHSAWLGLSEHPDWRIESPLPELKDAKGDILGWRMFENTMRSEQPDVPIVSPITGSYRFALLEDVLQKQTMKFIGEHPVYALELYGFYKPKKAVELILGIWAGIPLLAWVLVAPCFFAGTIALIYGLRSHVGELTIGVTLVAGASWAPIIWAYPGLQVIADQTYVTLFYALFIVAMIVRSIVQFAHGRSANRTKTVAHTDDVPLTAI